MRISLELTPDTVKKLAAQAEVRRVTLDLYLQAVLETVSHDGPPIPPDEERRPRTLRHALEIAQENRSTPRPSSPRRKKTDKYFN